MSGCDGHHEGTDTEVMTASPALRTNMAFRQAWNFSLKIII